MPKTIDLVRTRVDPANVDRMLALRPTMLAGHMARIDEHSWMDIVLWDNRAAADAAIRLVHNHPAVQEIGGLIESMISHDTAHLPDLPDVPDVPDVPDEAGR